jgi:hypothetical protein
VIQPGNWTLVDLQLLRTAASFASVTLIIIMTAQIMKQRAMGAVAGPRRQACPSALSVTRAAVRPAIAGRARECTVRVNQEVYRSSRPALIVLQ